jgi:hypothetical protein
MPALGFLRATAEFPNVWEDPRLLYVPLRKFSRDEKE